MALGVEEQSVGQIGANPSLPLCTRNHFCVEGGPFPQQRDSLHLSPRMSAYLPRDPGQVSNLLEFIFSSGNSQHCWPDESEPTVDVWYRAITSTINFRMVDYNESHSIHTSICFPLAPFPITSSGLCQMPCFVIQVNFYY